jgi:hypothetical protein
LLIYVDLVLFDIKQMDNKKHREATGKDNQLVLENAKKIAKLRPMRVRVPIIPGFNDSVDEVKAITRFAKEELGIADVDILSYNKLGEGKYEFLDKSYSPLQSIDEHYFEASRPASRSRGPEWRRIAEWVKDLRLILHSESPNWFGINSRTVSGCDSGSPDMFPVLVTLDHSLVVSWIITLSPKQSWSVNRQGHLNQLFNLYGITRIGIRKRRPRTG